MQALSVTGLFVEDHRRILFLLQNFKENKDRNIKKSIEVFNQLRQALQKHFREEDILYSKCKYSTGTILPILNTIRTEHHMIYSKLNEIQNALNTDQKIDLSGFYDLLEKHRDTEEEFLYPEFDNILSDRDKEDVYWKIKVE